MLLELRKADTGPDSMSEDPMPNRKRVWAYLSVEEIAPWIAGYISTERLKVPEASHHRLVQHNNVRTTWRLSRQLGGMREEREGIAGRRDRSSE